MMILDEAIKHCREIAELNIDCAEKCDLTDETEGKMAVNYGECANEHLQLAEWLQELKDIKEKLVYNTHGEMVLKQDVIEGLYGIKETISESVKNEILKMIKGLKPISYIVPPKYCKPKDQ